MGFSTKRKKKKLELALLEDMYRLQMEWMHLKDVMSRSVEPTEIGRYQLKVAEIKYFFLLKEARKLHLNAHQS